MSRVLEIVSPSCTPRNQRCSVEVWERRQQIIQMVKSGNVEPLSDGTYKRGLRLDERGAREWIQREPRYRCCGEMAIDYSGYESTQDLIDEGISRDVIRIIQDMRKEGKYQVSDRVRVRLILTIPRCSMRFSNSLILLKRP